MNTVLLITARMKSTRLPRKLLREVCGRPIIAHMLDRLKLATRVDRIVICTSTNPQDDVLVELADSENVSYFRGDEEDVLKRLSDCAAAFSAEYILSVTGDCPFADPVYADRVVDAYGRTNADLVRALDLPHGAYCYGIKPSALHEVLRIKDSSETEVWGRYFTDTGLFDVHDLAIENPLHRQPELRMTLDYEEDLEFFNAIFAELYSPGEVFSLDDILLFLRENPSVAEINKRCEDLYKKRVSKQSEIKLKRLSPVQRAAVIGCGSIGQRHIRNLRALGVSDIVALRSRKGHFKELNPDLHVHEVFDWDELLGERPDVAIVSNPTSLHLEAANRLVSEVRGLFVEKPLSSSLDGVHELLLRAHKSRTVTFVGHNLQYHAGIRALKAVLDEGKLGRPLLFQCQVGHWLPDWHPYEDYRKAYCARRDLGGGVARTLIHEIHLAVDLLGSAQRVSALFPDSDLLEIETDAVADLMIEHTTGAVTQAHLDFIQRPLHRCAVLSCERGWLSYDLVAQRVLAQFDDLAGSKVLWEDAEYNGNEGYVEEMADFLRYVEEGRIHHDLDFRQATRSLAVVDTALRSSATKRWEELPAWAARPT